MASTVIQAFNEFLANTVNLRKEDTQTARSSRDWLVDQIAGFPDKVDKFPRIYNEKITFFGSFARRTKKRPLDDVDIMICLSAEGSTYYEGFTTISIDVASNAERLKSLCNTDSNTLNSIRVVNKFVSALKTVPQYRSAETKRNQEAAILQLNSYDWNFDIVPCFFTAPDSTGKSYYLIPDGSGGWKKTDRNHHSPLRAWLFGPRHCSGSRHIPKPGSAPEEGPREGAEKRSGRSQGGNGEIPKLFPGEDE